MDVEFWDSAPVEELSTSRISTPSSPRSWRSDRRPGGLLHLWWDAAANAAGRHRVRPEAPSRPSSSQPVTGAGSISPLIAALSHLLSTGPTTTARPFSLSIRVVHGASSSSPSRSYGRSFGGDDYPALSMIGRNGRAASLSGRDGHLALVGMGCLGLALGGACQALTR